MKKIFIIVLCLSLTFSLTNCGGRGETITTEYTKNETSSSESLTGTPKVAESTVVDDKNFTKDKGVLTGTPNDSTLSGYAPLNKVSYEVSDPENTRKLSTEKISHSHGPASNGQPHYTVVEFQKTFDKYGALTLDTSGEKVLYLTFDCGYEYENLTSQILDVLKEKKVSAAFFCTLDHIKKEENLIARMIKEGHIVGNHSATHPSFATITRAKMAKEIEDTENYLRENFGYSAKYFRFPAGEYNENALELVSSLGYMSVFWSVAYDDWVTDNVRGKDYAIEKVMSRLHSGAVILLHSVSKDNAAALGEIIDKARGEGYEFRSLEEYKK